MSNMTAKSLLKERRPLTSDSFLDMVIWQVPEPKLGSDHHFKYRLAFIVDGSCVLRYDNEAGKGNHKHIGDTEVAYTFTTLKQLVDDFLGNVSQWRQEHEHGNN